MTTTHDSVSKSAFGGVIALVNALGMGLAKLGDRHSKLRQANALMALSDEELEDRGLKRSEIARYVFADSYWT
jgi:uncharacterized protein YjiS (DUF1127 family)